MAIAVISKCSEASAAALEQKTQELTRNRIRDDMFLNNVSITMTYFE